MSVVSFVEETGLSRPYHAINTGRVLLIAKMQLKSMERLIFSAVK
jgi:hypothetical protein